eukprot:m.263273 g.263273  ORF g.263273 m.263273 type:complete len:57 (+) comp19706_c0_seq29:2639-2809(+)
MLCISNTGDSMLYVRITSRNRSSDSLTACSIASRVSGSLSLHFQHAIQQNSFPHAR